MFDDRLGRIDHLLIGGLQSIADIELLVGEQHRRIAGAAERRGEAARLQERLAFKGDVAACEPFARRDLAQVVAPVDDAEIAEEPVVQPRRPWRNLARADAAAYAASASAIGVEGSDELAQPIGRGYSVVVHEGDELAARGFYAAAAGVGQARLRFEEIADVARIRIVAPAKALGRLLVGRIVYDDDFEGRRIEILLEQRLNCIFEVCISIVAGNNGGEV